MLEEGLCYWGWDCWASRICLPGQAVEWGPDHWRSLQQSQAGKQWAVKSEAEQSFLDEPSTCGVSKNEAIDISS